MREDLQSMIETLRYTTLAHSAATDSSLTRACFGLRFDATLPGSRPIVWAGREGNAPEPGCREIHDAHGKAEPDRETPPRQVDAGEQLAPNLYPQRLPHAQLPPQRGEINIKLPS